MQEADKRLDLALWVQAFDRYMGTLCGTAIFCNFVRYALAAEMTDQLKFSDAIGHKCLVLDLANQAGSEGRTRLLGVLYDELCRRVVKLNCLLFIVCVFA